MKVANVGLMIGFNFSRCVANWASCRNGSVQTTGNLNKTSIWVMWSYDFTFIFTKVMLTLMFERKMVRKEIKSNKFLTRCRCFQGSNHTRPWQLREVLANPLREKCSNANCCRRSPSYRLWAWTSREGRCNAPQARRTCRRQAAKFKRSKKRFNMMYD